jgi:DNA-directed RNA polymerase specialized sigma24 family protein
MKASKLASRRAELLRQIDVIGKEINKLVSIEQKFFSEETPVLHRRHGWLNDDERAKIVRYFSAGISSVEIAEKFACSTPTVYNCMRRVLRENSVNTLG